MLLNSIRVQSARIYVFLFAFVMVISSIECRIHKLYIYENENNIKMHDKFPSDCEHLHHNFHLNKKHHKNQCNIFTEEYGYNEGYGYYDINIGIYETWQYGMFRNIYSRLIRSPLRTYNKSEATLFFLPYDSGTESYMDAKGNYRGSGNELAPSVLNIISKSNSFHKNYGLDHFLIHSTSMVAQGIGNKLKNLYKYMHNSTIISFEYLPLIPWAQGRPFHQALPFPSVYHHTVKTISTDTSDVDVDHSISIPALKLSHNRTHFVSFFGSTHTNMAASNHLRRSLEEQCININKKTTNEFHIDLQKKYNGVCVHKSIDKKDRNVPIINQFIDAYRHSVFCLMPAGDTPLRKGIVDSLLAGCIPVVITGTDHVLDQYNWLYTKIDIELAFIVLLMDSPEVSDIMKTLAKYNEKEVREKQEHISKIALRSQYSIPPDCVGRTLPDPMEVMTPWNPSSEHRDAVDYMLDGFMKHVDKYVFNE